MPENNEEKADELEKAYPGIRDQIRRFEEAKLPPCPLCKSENTASVQVGIIGRTIHIAAATRKIHLRLNGKPGEYYCNDCKKYFNSPESY